MFSTVKLRIIANNTNARAEAYPYRVFSKNSAKIVTLKGSVVPSAAPSRMIHMELKALNVPIIARSERK